MLKWLSRRTGAAILTAAVLFLAACSSGGTATPIASTASSAAASAAPAASDTPAPSGEVTALMLGWPDQDGTDPATGRPVKGIGYLKTTFEASHPGITLNIVNIPYGSGATGYGPKTESMVLANEACVYTMPAVQDYAQRGLLQNLDALIANDPGFVNPWGVNLDTYRMWGTESPDGAGIPDGLWAVPSSSDHRIINWDAKLFTDWGVEPLTKYPTIEEIETKAPKLTGTNPVTGQQNYGFWYQGKYTVLQFLTVGHAFGGHSAVVGADGKVTVTWNTPEYLAALKWFLKMAQYAPPGALAADAMPPGFMTDESTVAIIPDGEPGYYLAALLAKPELRDRFRVSGNIVGPDGLGGLRSQGPMTMAASCPNKPAAWEVLKFLAGSRDAQRYYFETNGLLPTLADSTGLVPELDALPDADVILNATSKGQEINRFPPKPRFALQAWLEAALAGTATPEEALANAQKETDDFMAQQP
jgi:multiple sugar transport system substrate-binding protein